MRTSSFKPNSSSGTEFPTEASLDLLAAADAEKESGTPKPDAVVVLKPCAPVAPKPDAGVPKPTLGAFAAIVSRGLRLCQMVTAKGACRSPAPALSTPPAGAAMGDAGVMPLHAALARARGLVAGATSAASAASAAALSIGGTPR